MVYINGYYLVIIWLMMDNNVFWLVVDLPRKMMEWKSVGIMKFPIINDGKIKFMFQTTNQL